jgi:hypothetical protein
VSGLANRVASANNRTRAIGNAPVAGMIFGQLALIVATIFSGAAL